MSNTVAVVTGAAGGMGAPSATRLADLGHDLILCDMSAERLEQTAEPLRAKGVNVEILAGDLAAIDFPSQLLALVGDREIGALIHTAGLSPTMADGPRIFEVNYHASKRLADAICPKMAADSAAVFISSTSAYMVNSPEVDAAIKALIAGDSSIIEPMVGTPQGAYAISKRAVIALVGAQSTPFGKRKARICSIAPGLIATSMGNAEFEANEMPRKMLAATPLERTGVGDEIASVAVFLCSKDASFISGCDIKVDGGMLAAMGF